MIPLTLWLLATFDAAFIGYREAAGRSALIDKRAYYRKAMVRGAFFGQLAVFGAAVFIGAAVLFSAEPGALIDELHRLGARLLTIYIPFALIILLAFALRSISSVDIKSITSTVIFGPFTLLRPAVAVAGVIYALIAAPKLIFILFGALILTLMLGLGRALGRLRACGLIS
jgi:hypothetical protein